VATAGDRGPGFSFGAAAVPNRPADRSKLPATGPTALASLRANPLPRILPIEDNGMNRDMLSRRLVRGGHDVSIATDGKQAIDKVLARGAG
jgi:hypothetical protein